MALFLDSGAHSLYRHHVPRKGPRDYQFYTTSEFWRYVDQYADFVNAYAYKIDHFANVDVLFHPELSWQVQDYLEQTHGLRPVPVVHFGSDLTWLCRYIDAGHTFIGLGGLGQQVSKKQYEPWADKAYELIAKHGRKIRTHGFAMTSPSLMARYSWWSVDSAAWVKAAGFGNVIVPRKRQGIYSFRVKPRYIPVSTRAIAKLKKKGRLSERTQLYLKLARTWFRSNKLNFAHASRHYGPRVRANLLYFARLAECQKVKLFYSGDSSPELRPERVLSNADVMLTYYEMRC